MKKGLGDSNVHMRTLVAQQNPLTCYVNHKKRQYPKGQVTDSICPAII